MVGLGQKGDAWVGPNAVPQGPGFGHGFGFSCHDRFSGEQAEDGELSETAEEELLLRSFCKPGESLFGMNVAVPNQSQPNVRIKEIQRVHTFVRW